MDRIEYLTLQDEIFLDDLYFDFNTQFEDYELKEDGYYAKVIIESSDFDEKTKEYGPFPLNICFLSQVAIDQEKLFLKYYYTAGQDKVTDYYTTVKEEMGIDMELNHKAQHNGSGLVDEYDRVKNS